MKVTDAVQAKAEQVRDEANASVQQAVDGAKAAPGIALLDAKAAVDERQHRQGVRLRGAPARPLCLPRARLAAQGSVVLPERGPGH